ncbi:MAG: hypothetical protein ABI537_03290 [Casimicrobiaceae bacterium]
MIASQRLLAIASVALACVACGKSAEERDKARVAEQWRIEQAAAAQERLEQAKKRREMEASNDVQTRKEAGDAFAAYSRERPAMTPVQQTEALDAAVASVRARMSDPPTMQVRNVRLSPTGNAVCMEVNYKDAEKYLGFRQAFVGPGVIWVEPAPDDLSHRVFDLNYQKLGCANQGPGK